MSGAGTLKNFKEMLGTAQLPEKTVPICLRGDLVAEFEQTERALEREQDQAGGSLDGGGQVGFLAERIETLRDQMREHTYTFRLRALPKRQWRSLVADYPPRPTEDGGIDDRDRYIGVNTETFFDAMIRACLVDPELDDETWSELNDKLTDNQYDSLANTAWSLNRSDVDIPFSRAASLISRTSEPE